jgi:predicted permease
MTGVSVAQVKIPVLNMLRAFARMFVCVFVPFSALVLSVRGPHMTILGTVLLSGGVSLLAAAMWTLYVVVFGERISGDNSTNSGDT